MYNNIINKKDGRMDYCKVTSPSCHNLSLFFLGPSFHPYITVVALIFGHSPYSNTGQYVIDLYKDQSWNMGWYSFIISKRKKPLRTDLSEGCCRAILHTKDNSQYEDWEQAWNKNLWVIYLILQRSQNHFIFCWKAMTFDPFPLLGLSLESKY